MVGWRWERLSNTRRSKAEWIATQPVRVRFTHIAIELIRIYCNRIDSNNVVSEIFQIIRWIFSKQLSAEGT